MRPLFRERNFMLLLASGTVSELGDWALLLALPFYVYGRTESILATGGLVAAELVPRILLSPIAGVLADRWNRQLTLAGVNLFRACLVLAILVPAAGGPIWLVYGVAVLEAASAQLVLSAEGGLLPNVLDREEMLLAANSLLSTGTALTRLVGPALGGILFAALGLGGAVVVDSASFVVSALAILAIRSTATSAGGDTAEHEPPGPRFLGELVDGARFVVSNPICEALCLTLGVVMIAQGILEPLLVPFVRDVLHFDPVQYGIVLAAQGVGGLVGALGLGLISRYLTSGLVVGGALLLAGVFTFGFALARPLVLSAACVLLLSVPLMVAAIWIQTYYQQHVEDRLLGRVLGLTETASALGVLLGVIAASLLGGSLGTVTLLIAASCVLLIAGLAAVIALRGASTVAVP